MFQHLKSHGIVFLEYIKANLSLFPDYKYCKICNINLTRGTTCSKKCNGQLVGQLRIGGIGWSRGYTKDTHSGLKSVSDKAKLRTGTNIWARMSDETRAIASKKISDSAKERVKGSGNPMFGRKHSPETIQKIFSNFKMNKFEKKFAKFLDDNDIEYKYNYFTGLNSIYSYDFKINGINLLIELDGDYWHGGPGCSKHCHFVENIIERDRIKSIDTIANGYELIRIWESDYKKNEDLIHNNIKERISNIKLTSVNN